MKKWTTSAALIGAAVLLTGMAAAQGPQVKVASGLVM